MACAQMTQAAPWRRGNTLSSEAAVFVPSNTLSSEAAVFVPKTSAAGNCCLISLGAYSDDSDDDSVSEKTTAAPTPVAAVATTEATTPTDDTSLSLRRPWRVSAPEFVPRSTAEPFVPKQEETPPAAEVAVEEPWWKRGRCPTSEAEVLAEGSETTKSDGKIAPWRRSTSSVSGTPTKADTLSTSEGSPNASSSSEASDASCASRSRSPTPPPTPLVEEVTALGIHALLQWRNAAQRPAEQLPFASEPEAGTPAAAGAAYAAAEAAGGGKTPAATGSHSTGLSWRHKEPEEKSWRSEAQMSPAKKLEVSPDSWQASQAMRRRSKSSVAGETDGMSDEDVVRAMKSILNKLTVEKFESLSVQLIHCGIRNPFHLELLIQEVFEKATTQHHFIDMYADLCDLLNIHFAEHPLSDDPKKNFKKVLLHCCQASFEKHLTPPKGIASLKGEDRAVEERKYKMRMLGNIRFVGSLLVRKMLASKVMLAIMEELLQEPTPEALESLAALLMVVGPTFDTPDWAYRMTLDAIFKQLEKLTKKSSVDSRVRCLLKDVLEVRNAGWHDRRPKKIEGPLKLDQVAKQAAQENGSSWVTQKSPCSGNDWETVGKDRMGKLCNLLNSKAPTPCSTPTAAPAKQQSKVVTPKEAAGPEKTTRGGSAGAAMLMFLKSRDQPESPKQEEVQKPFDLEACKKEIASTLEELRVSHDVPDAILRIAEISVPVPEQSVQFNDILASLSEESTHDIRKVGFKLVVGLILDGHWKAESASKGLQSFLTTCEDLKLDVPALPTILRDELHPALAPLVKAGFVQAEHQNAFMTI